MALQQKSYFALYDFGNEVKLGMMKLVNAEIQSLEDANDFCRELKKKGIKYSRSTSMQTREWWELGVPCGLSCKAVLVTWNG